MDRNSYNPFGGYDFYDDIVCSDARRDSSRFFLGLFLFNIAAYAVIFILELAFMLALGEKATNLFASPYFSMLIGTLPLYLIGLPILYFFVKGMKTRKISNQGFTLGEFLALIPISQCVMTVGSYIGEIFSLFFSAVKGGEVTNGTAELIENSPIGLTFILVVIIGPLVEEFIFRKLMIDRFAKYGYVFSIIISSIAFGLFHGNFYQFFYAAFMGAVLGYIYIRSGNWIYSYVMHAIINFLGSVVTLFVADELIKFAEFTEIIYNGGEVDALEYNKALLIVESYSIIQLALVIIGAVLLVMAFRKRWISIKDTAKMTIPKNRVFKVCTLNPGAICFILFSLGIFALNIML